MIISTTKNRSPKSSCFELNPLLCRCIWSASARWCWVGNWFKSVINHIMVIEVINDSHFYNVCSKAKHLEWGKCLPDLCRAMKELVVCRTFSVYLICKIWFRDSPKYGHMAYLKIYLIDLYHRRRTKEPKIIKHLKHFRHYWFTH